MNKDLQSLILADNWIEKLRFSIQLLNHNDINIPIEFNSTFPLMGKLLAGSRKLFFELEQQSYALYSWDDISGNPCGWLCRIEKQPISDIPYCQHHHLLCDTMLGGITESYHSTEWELGVFVNNIEYKLFTMNQNFMFTRSRYEKGIGDDQMLYDDYCLFGDCQPIDLTQYITFTKEGHGARTLYHIKSEKVMYFGYNHYEQFHKLVKGQPEYSFYHIKGIKTFTDYVETLAMQWLSFVKLPS